MIRWTTIAMLAALFAACGKDGGGGAQQKPNEPEKPIACPAGSVPALDNKTCVAVVTPEKVQAVQAEKTRLEKLAEILHQVDTMSAPIELLDGMRQLDAWKKIAATNDKFLVLDKIVEALNQAVKEVRALEQGLGTAATRLGNVQGELDKLLKDNTGKTLAEVQKQVSADVRAALEPLAVELATAAEKVLVPVTAQVSSATDIVLGACAMAKMGGGGDKLKELCDRAKDTLPKAVAFLEDTKAKPAALLDEMTDTLVKQLDQLIDAETRAALDAAQAKVNAALQLPAAGAGSGSAAAGSGSATP
jgi:hypothetical protein